MMAGDLPLKDLRVLVVEDDYLIAGDIGLALEDAAASVVGPVGRLPEAVALAREAEVDLAVLDADLHGESSADVARILRQRHVPFLYLTGFADSFPDGGDGAKVLTKPFSAAGLAAALRSLLRARDG